jgi:hypothetical protein
MKRWIPKILAYLIMIPILVIGIIGSIIWNIVLISELVLKNIIRKYRKKHK